MENIKVMLSIIKSELKGENVAILPEGIDLAELLSVSKKHDLAHIVGTYLKKRRLIDGDIKKAFQQEIMTAFYRCEKQDMELANISGAFEKAKIPFLPLKGSYLKKFYPEPFMRTSCDIDILVKKEDLEKAKDILVNELSFEFKGYDSPHDISLFSPSEVHIELHFDLIEDNKIKKAHILLEDVWEKAYLEEGFSYRYVMDDTQFYVYMVAHMAKHVKHAGCGIRPFMDLVILDNVVKGDDVKRQNAIKEAELTAFYELAQKLKNVWFGEKEHTKETEVFEDYIIKGGAYGTKETKITRGRMKAGNGKIAYIIRRFFPTFEAMEKLYPRLSKCALLLPYYYVKRWISLLFGGKLKSSIKEIERNINLDTDSVDELTRLFNKMEI